MTRFRAFTLIELLIVVAIIAILAAIAVPNFLEAQVRSKTARVRADMRTVATAMEAYVVDYNRYPVPADLEGGMIADPVGATLVSPFETRVPALLTTPIAYLSSRPEDPFAKVRPFESRLYHTITTDYIDIRQFNAPTHNWRIIYRNVFRQMTGEDPPPAVRYILQSWGPDEVHDTDTPHLIPPPGPHTHNSASIYDPTNGTVSSGDIWYFGPGFGFAFGQ